MKSISILCGRFAAALLACAHAGRADPVLAWNEALTRFSTSAPRSMDCHLEARSYAMAHVAVDEAVARVQRLGGAMGEETMARAAVASAASGVLQECLPAGAAQFAALADAQLAALPEGEAKQRGMALGREAAELVSRKRERDGWAELTPDKIPRRLGGAAAFERILRDGTPLSPYRDLKPFVLRNPSQIEAPPLHWVTLGGEVETVQGLSRARIFDQVDRSALDEVTQVWAETPVVKWNRVARALSEHAAHDIGTRARMFAVLNLALADAALATLHWQFTYGSWRCDFRQVVVTDAALAATLHASQSVDPMSYYGTRRIMLPPIQNFPSAHAALAGAAQAALIATAKADRLPIAVAPPVHGPGRQPLPPRQFAGIVAAARECSFAATLDGSQSREAAVSGYMMGVRVGEYVAKRAAAGR